MPLVYLCLRVGVQIAKSVFYGLYPPRPSGPSAAVLAYVKKAA